MCEVSYMVLENIDFGNTLTEMRFLLKNNVELIITTTIAECCDFVDWLNQNKVVYYKYKVEQDMQEFFVFEDYAKKETVCIKRSEIKAFTIPWFKNNNNQLEMKLISWYK